jgi:hypothetical protein
MVSKQHPFNPSIFKSQKKRLLSPQNAPPPKKKGCQLVLAVPRAATRRIAVFFSSSTQSIRAGVTWKILKAHGHRTYERYKDSDPFCVLVQSQRAAIFFFSCKNLFRLAFDFHSSVSFWSLYATRLYEQVKKKWWKQIPKNCSSDTYIVFPFFPVFFLSSEESETTYVFDES